ncbi:hypothetical protein N9O48_03190 [Gammaproteobacteria bacterium]|nr:hypothetical protein [Gammaproteobacteria bacterium]
MEDRKERLDEVLRYFVIGYLALFVLTCIVLNFQRMNSIFFEIDSILYYGEIYESIYSLSVSQTSFPVTSLLTFGILVGARYIMFGKTYQK